MAITIQMSALTRAARIGKTAVEPSGAPSALVTTSRTLCTPGCVLAAS